MLVPEYWAEASTVVVKGERRINPRRFGSSNDNQNDAQQHADERLKGAVTSWNSDQSIHRRDRKNSL